MHGDTKGAPQLRLLSWLERRIDLLSGAYRPSTRALGYFRIAYALAMLAYGPTFAWALHAPAEFFNPGPGLQRLFSSAPPEGYVATLIVLFYVSAVWLLVGWRTTAASVSATVVSVLGGAVAYSFSKVDHTILFELVPVVMACSGWGSAVSLDGRRRSPKTSGYPLFLWSMVIAFAFATAAAAKALGGWWRPDHYGSWNFVAADYLSGEQPGVLAGFVLHHQPAFFWKLIDWGTLFAEGWLVLAFLSPVLFRIGLVLLSIFHSGVFLMLDIRFDSFAFVYAPFFLALALNGGRKSVVDEAPEATSVAGRVGAS